MKAGDWGRLLLLSLLWGGAFLFYKILDNAGLPPLTIVLGRVGLAALALIPVVRALGLAFPSRLSDWLPYAVLGITNNAVPFFLIASGETQISSGLASILNATTPIFTAIVAHFATADERFSANKIAGIGLGFAGIVALVGPEAVGGLNITSLAQIACLCAAISYAFAGVYGKRFRGTPLPVIATSQLIASTLMLLPLELILDKPWTLSVSWQTWLALLVMALGGTAAAYILYFGLIVSAGAVNASLVTLLVPVIALLLGGVFLHEHPAWTALAGMALIFCGLAAIDGRVLILVSFAAVRKAKVWH
ncbi:MAG: DMT family transporter [Candidatus Eremiobacteraeota bacterium]|nr:DMT family transporter [Candidatus Eremiobacteraeota bacterium]